MMDMAAIPLTLADGQPLPWPLTIRESKRAKHVTLKVTVTAEIEVVVPLGFDRYRLPDIISARYDWITNSLKRVEASGRSRSDSTHCRPECLDLLALGETWSIVYLETSNPVLKVRAMGDRTLSLVGKIYLPLCHQALRRWLKRKAKLELVPQLQAISEAVNLPYARVGIRGQKTRWGSCSSQQHISLNYKLLFLPPELVRYVLTHELCHTLHMNHGPKFWALVAEKYPSYKTARHQLKQSWRYLPAWLEQSSD
ncbi:MAG: SprT family zinc-dependent metalloprotease [Cyanobacteria bacterium P01_H01_bin.119]